MDKKYNRNPVAELDQMAARKRIRTELEEARQVKAAEASRLMKELGLLLDKQRIFERWVIRLRRESDMFPLWTKRGTNDDTLLNEMLRWLQQEKERRNKK